MVISGLSPRKRRLALVVAGLLPVAMFVPASSARLADTAPGAPGGPALWTRGNKNGFGTARTLASKVWYTLNDGKLSELFYPRIDTPSIRDTQFVVTDGATFTDREDRDTTHQVRLLDRHSLDLPAWSTRAKSGKYRITKTFVTDPARSTVLVEIAFRVADRASPTRSTCCTTPR